MIIVIKLQNDYQLKFIKNISLNDYREGNKF